MTSFDERIRAALHNAPANPAPPLERIAQRASSIHNRRRAAGVGAIVIASAAVVLPFSMLSTDPSVPTPAPAGTAISEPTPTKTELADDGTVFCERWSGEARPQALDLNDVPDHLRVMWDSDVAGPPTGARASDWTDVDEIETSRYPEGCTIPDDAADSSLTLVLAEDSVVTQHITISSPTDLGEEFFREVSTRLLVTDAGPLYIEVENGRVFWPAGNGHYWAAISHPRMGDKRLADLAATIRLTEGEIDATRWSGHQDVVAEVGAADPGNPVRSTLGVSYNVYGPLSLTVESGATVADLWRSAQVDDEIVDVNGLIGLLSAHNTHIEFMLHDDVIARVAANNSKPVDLLSIARSIEPVAADDLRLTEVWQTEFEE